MLKQASFISYFFSFFLMLVLSFFCKPLVIHSSEITSDNTTDNLKNYTYKYVPEILSSVTENIDLSNTDIFIQNNSFPLQIIRKFDNKTKNDIFPFGKGWTLNYDIRMNFSPDDKAVIIVNPDKSTVKFSKIGKGKYQNTSNKNDTIFWDKKNKTYKQYIKNKIILSFTIKGYLKKLYSSDDKFHELNYKRGRRLSKITTQKGHYAEFKYNKRGFISEIKTDLGVSILYSYNNNSELTCVHQESGDIKYTYKAGNIKIITYPDNRISKFKYINGE